MEPKTFDDYFGQWSASKLKTLKHCPLQYYLKYIVKLKMPEDTLQDTVARDAGKALHAVLEYVIKGLSHEEAVRKVRMEYTKSAEEWETVVAPDIQNTKVFAERFQAFAKKYDVQKAFPEVRLGVRKDWSLCDFFAKDVFFRGVLDLALWLKNDDVIIIDHKRGGSAEFGIRNYESQLDIYKILVHAKIPTLKNVISGIHFISEGTIPLGAATSAEIIRDIERPKLVYDIACTVESAVEPGVMKHKRGPYCNYCDYDSICKAKLYKPHEEASKEFLKKIIPIASSPPSP